VNVEPAAPTVDNPPEQFAGDVWVDMIAAPQDAMTTAREVFTAADRGGEKPS
jgi:hypothetical protein